MPTAAVEAFTKPSIHGRFPATLVDLLLMMSIDGCVHVITFRHPDSLDSLRLPLTVITCFYCDSVLLFSSITGLEKVL